MDKNNKVNYNLAMEKQIALVHTGESKPTLLLHSCCAPCSSYVLRVLQKYFNITVFYYNPNLYPDKEYTLRLKEQKRLIKIYNKQAKQKNRSGENKVSDIFIETPIKIKTLKFNTKEYYNAIKGKEDSKERGERCYLCYKLRINKTAIYASKLGYDYFATTLTVSPYKVTEWINEIGEAEGLISGVSYLFSDFKKNDGYKKSIEYSKEFGLYRQDYCGCKYSVNTLEE